MQLLWTEVLKLPQSSPFDIRNLSFTNAECDKSVSDRAEATFQTIARRAGTSAAIAIDFYKKYFWIRYLVFIKWKHSNHGGRITS